MKKHRLSKHKIDRDEWTRRSREFVKRGEDLPQSKCTVELVRKMRAEYRYGCKNWGAPALARRYGLHVRTVEKIIAQETWIHA